MAVDVATPTRRTRAVALRRLLMRDERLATTAGSTAGRDGGGANSADAAASAGSQLLAVRLFADHELTFDPGDDKIGAALASGKAWQRHDLTAALAILDAANRRVDPAIFVDVGANIGVMTVYAHLSGCFDGAVAIEPEPFNLALLRRNLAANGLADRVTVVGAAASDRHQRARLAMSRRNRGAHSLDAGHVTGRAGGSIEVETAPLDDLLASAGVAASTIGLVKIDVEGHELDVLAGMPGVLAARAPLMIEVTTGPHPAARSEALRAALSPWYEAAFDLSGGVGATRVPLAGLTLSRRQHELLVI